MTAERPRQHLQLADEISRHASADSDDDRFACDRRRLALREDLLAAGVTASYLLSLAHDR